MGQEVSVTTLQLAQAACVIANGGLLVQPRLVLKKGDQVDPAAKPVRIIKPETAITMRQMMEGVVLYGTGTPVREAGTAIRAAARPAPRRFSIPRRITIRTPTTARSWASRR